MRTAFTNFIQQMNLRSGTVKLSNRCWGWFGTVVSSPGVYEQPGCCRETRGNVANVLNNPLTRLCGTNTIK